MVPHFSDIVANNQKWSKFKNNMIKNNLSNRNQLVMNNCYGTIHEIKMATLHMFALFRFHQ